MPFPLPEQHLLDAETRLGVRFPASYRAHLLRENGGCVREDPTWGDDWELYPIRDPTNRRTMLRTFNDLERESPSAGAVPVPAGAIAFATNAAGDCLVFVRGPDGTLADDVFIWSHEERALVPLVSDFAGLDLWHPEVRGSPSPG